MGNGFGNENFILIDPCPQPIPLMACLKRHITLLKEKYQCYYYVHGVGEETAIHALFECTYAKKMWKLSPLGPVISTWKERSNFMNLLIGSCKLGHEFGRNEFAWFCGMAHMA